MLDKLDELEKALEDSQQENAENKSKIDKLQEALDAMKNNQNNTEKENSDETKIAEIKQDIHNVTSTLRYSEDLDGKAVLKAIDDIEFKISTLSKTDATLTDSLNTLRECAFVTIPSVALDKMIDNGYLSTYFNMPDSFAATTYWNCENNTGAVLSDDSTAYACVNKGEVFGVYDGTEYSDTNSEFNQLSTYLSNGIKDSLQTTVDSNEATDFWCQGDTYYFAYGNGEDADTWQYTIKDGYLTEMEQGGAIVYFKVSTEQEFTEKYEEIETKIEQFKESQMVKIPETIAVQLAELESATQSESFNFNDVMYALNDLENASFVYMGEEREIIDHKINELRATCVKNEMSNEFKRWGEKQYVAWQQSLNGESMGIVLFNFTSDQYVATGSGSVCNNYYLIHNKGVMTFNDDNATEFASDISSTTAKEFFFGGVNQAVLFSLYREGMNMNISYEDGELMIRNYDDDSSMSLTIYYIDGGYNFIMEDSDGTTAVVRICDSTEAEFQTVYTEVNTVIEETTKINDKLSTYRSSIESGTYNAEEMETLLNAVLVEIENNTGLSESMKEALSEKVNDLLNEVLEVEQEIE